MHCSSLIIDADYFRNQRNKKNPSAGPVVKPLVGKTLKLKAWRLFIKNLAF